MGIRTTAARLAEGFALLHSEDSIPEAFERDMVLASSGFGRWIHENMVSGGESFPVSDPEIDRLVELAFSGALRGR